MIIEESTNPFGICFNLIKIKYQIYDDSLTSLGFLNPTDKINVFINLETVLKYLSMTKDLEKKLVVNRNFPDYMESDIINIAAHYKDFFRGNGLDTKVYLYMTDLDSKISEFKETKYIEEFRSYYMNKYTENPRFVLFGDRLRNEIIPNVKTICEFIPNVYFIQSKNIDGGVIPYIIAQAMPERKNLIISGDIHDTQYAYETNFVDHLHIRGYNVNVLAATTEDYLKTISKSKEISPDMVELFKNGSFYRVLLACLGDKYRSVDGIRGIKFGKMVKILIDALRDQKITKETRNASLLADLFPEDVREQIYQNLQVLDICNEYEMLLEGDKKQIVSQIIDRSDINALQQLNRTKFSNNQLRLECLLK